MKRLFFILSIFLLSSCLKTGAPETPYNRIKPGDNLPAFRIILNGGKIVSGASLWDEDALIVFFNTECPDCVAELPIIQAFYEEWQDRVTIFAVSREEGAESVSAYWEENDYTIPFCAEQGRDTYSLFSSAGIPLVVFSRDGIVIGAWDDKDFFTEEKFLELY